MYEKWLVGFSILLFIALICIYLFIPSTLLVSKVTPLNCTVNGTYRVLSDEAEWHNWCSKDSSTIENSKLDISRFRYGSNSYLISTKLRNSVEVFISGSHFQYPSSINLFPSKKDSAIAVWECKIPTSWNPLKRVYQYQAALDIKNNMTAIMKNFQLFVEKTENVYKIPIILSSIKDSFLVTTKYYSPSYPTIDELYKHFDILKEFIGKEGAKQTGNPMLNVTKLNPTGFQVMEALPTNKLLAQKDQISPSRMIPGGFVVTQVTGGPFTIENALKQIQLYFEDYHKTAMAIPFQYLITDRRKETDSTKWITRIYAPVFR